MAKFTQGGLKKTFETFKSWNLKGNINKNMSFSLKFMKNNL